VPDDDTTKQLAQDLLDELDKPKSPEREAYEIRKEREDREALERFYISTGQAKPQLIIAHVLADLAAAIETANPTENTFEPIEVAFTYQNRKGVLRFIPSPSPKKPERRYLELSIKSESGVSTSSAFIDDGTNESIVAYLRKPEVVADTMATIEDLMQSLSRNRLA